MHPSVRRLILSAARRNVWDFTSGALPTGVTYSGNAGLGTRTNSAGLIVQSVADQPRLDYDPVTLAALGILIEPERTNILLRSAEADNPSWTRPNSDTISANAVTAPDGAAAGDTFVETGANTPHTLQQALTVTADAAMTASVYLRQAGRSIVKLRFTNAADTNGVAAEFNLATGAIATAAAAIGTGSSPSATIQAAGGGWYRCALTGITGAGNTSAALRLRPLTAAGGSETFTGLNAASFSIWGAGMIAGTYIPTAGAQVTRTADVLTLLALPAGNYRLTFSDDTTSDIVHAGGNYVAPTSNLRRLKRIRRI